MYIAVCVPQLHVGEDHHLVHHLSAVDEVFDDQMAVGGIAYLTHQHAEAFHVAEDGPGRQLLPAPGVAKDACNHMLASAAHEHGQHKTDVIVLHAAAWTDGHTHGAGGICSQEHAGLQTEACDVFRRNCYRFFQCLQQDAYAAGLQLAEFAPGSEEAHRQLLAFAHRLRGRELQGYFHKDGIADACLNEVAQVAQHGHVAEATAHDEFFPLFGESRLFLLIGSKGLLAEAGDFYLPGIRHLQRLCGNLVKEGLLRSAGRAGMGEEKRIAQGHLCGAVVLGKLVLIKLVEGIGNAFLQLLAEFVELLLAFAGVCLLVVCQHLSDLIGTLDDAGSGLAYKSIRGTVAGQLYGQHHRDTAQVHLLAAIDGQLRDELRRYLVHQLADALQALHFTLIKLSGKAGCHYGSIEFHLRIHRPGFGALVVADDLLRVFSAVEFHGFPCLKWISVCLMIQRWGSSAQSFCADKIFFTFLEKTASKPCL